MTGMNRTTGAAMSELDNIRQSITDILTTPVGSRVMRRDYGSQLPELIDAPGNATTRQQLVAATVDALTKWEPRLSIERVSITTTATSGQWGISISGRLADNTPITTSLSLTRGLANG